MEQTIIPQLSFSEAINASTSKIFQFTGRSRRSEYWWTMALVYVISIVLTPLGLILALFTIPLTFRRLHDIGKSGWWYGCCLILKVLFLASLIYDIVMCYLNVDNMEGYEDQLGYTLLLKYGIWFLVIAIYQIILFIFMCFDSDQYENDYGISPKYQQEETSNNE